MLQAGAGAGAALAIQMHSPVCLFNSKYLFLSDISAKQEAKGLDEASPGAWLPEEEGSIARVLAFASAAGTRPVHSEPLPRCSRSAPPRL